MGKFFILIQFPYKLYLQLLIIASLTIIYFFVFSVSKAQADDPIVYVDSDATGANTGLTWTDAYTDLQVALTNAISGTQIWVAAGTYKPGANLTDSFQLKNGVRIYGGFVGTESNMEERNWKNNVTILSGDVNDNDSSNVIYGDSTRSDNIYHVVIGGGTDNTAILDGFIVSGGHARWPQGWGGGMYNYTGSPLLRNIVFSRNVAQYGAGMANYEYSSPILSHVIFQNNVANDNGGGMLNTNESNVTLSQVIFSGNVANDSGGGMYNTRSSCPMLNNVIFSGNRTWNDGGAIANNRWSSSRPVIYNSILWNNSPNQIVDTGYSYTTVRYSIVQGGWGWSDSHNLNADPLFNSPINPSSAPTDAGDFHLNADSPAIDAGNNDFIPQDLTDIDNDGNTNELVELDLDGSDRLIYCKVDQGAYEFLSSSGPDICLNMSKSVVPNYARPGSIITYTLSFSNTGSDTAVGVVITDFVPISVTNLSVLSSGTTITQINSSPTQPYIWQVEDISPNEGGIITIKGLLNPTLPRSVFTNTATIATSSLLPSSIRTISASIPVIIGGVIYVKADAPGANTGLTWADAFTDLQQALLFSRPGDQIWVAKGIYKPTDDIDRTISFYMSDGVTLYGGFRGTEIYLADRNWVTNLTVLSGDLNSDDGSVNNLSDNSYHVVVSSGDDLNLLDGFIVSGGNASDLRWPHNRGGGMYNYFGNTTVSNVIFEGNSAQQGGGIFNEYGDLTLNQVILRGNSAQDGGGIFNEYTSLNLNQATLSGNQAQSDGGAIYNLDSTSTINNSILWNNTPNQIADTSVSTSTVSYSIVQGGWLTGTHIHDLNPMFVSPIDPIDAPTTGGNFHLQTGSLAMDTGNNSLIPPDLTDMDGDRNMTEPIGIDLDGQPRIFNSTVDMGAYEFGPIIPLNDVYLPILLKD